MSPQSVSEEDYFNLQNLHILLKCDEATAHNADQLALIPPKLRETLYRAIMIENDTYLDCSIELSTKNLRFQRFADRPWKTEYFVTCMPTAAYICRQTYFEMLAALIKDQRFYMMNDTDRFDFNIFLCLRVGGLSDARLRIEKLGLHDYTRCLNTNMFLIRSLRGLKQLWLRFTSRDFVFEFDCAAQAERYRRDLRDAQAAVQISGLKLRPLGFLSEPDINFPRDESPSLGVHSLSHLLEATKMALVISSLPALTFLQFIVDDSENVVLKCFEPCDPVVRMKLFEQRVGKEFKKRGQIVQTSLMVRGGRCKGGGELIRFVTTGRGPDFKAFLMRMDPQQGGLEDGWMELW